RAKLIELIDNVGGGGDRIDRLERPGGMPAAAPNRNAETFARAGQRSLAHTDHTGIKKWLNMHRQNRRNLVDSALLYQLASAGGGFFAGLKHGAKIVLEPDLAKPPPEIMNHQGRRQRDGGVGIVAAGVAQARPGGRVRDLLVVIDVDTVKFGAKSHE